MKRKEIFKAGGLLSLIGIGIVVATLVMSQTGDVVVEQIYPMTWHPDVLGDANPGVGASGVLIVYIYPNGGTYTSNLTAGNAYAYGDVNNSHIGSNVPYNTAFDIVIKVRWNQSHCFNSSGTGQYMLGWVRGNITCSAFSLSDTAMDEYNITGCVTTTHIWVHYVADNSGVGYTISRGQNVTGCSFTFDAYY